MMACCEVVCLFILLMYLAGVIPDFDGAPWMELISSFGHLICFTFQANSTLALKQCGGGCWQHACCLLGHIPQRSWEMGLPCLGG